MKEDAHERDERVKQQEGRKLSVMSGKELLTFSVAVRISMIKSSGSLSSSHEIERPPSELDLRKTWGPFSLELDL